MSQSVENIQTSVTADDLALAVRLAVEVLRTASPDSWDAKAGTLEWDCWETVEHLSDDLFSYAAQLSPGMPLDRHVPFVYESRRPGGPANAIHADRQAGPDGLLQGLAACAGMLVAMVRTTPPQARAYHGYGISDAEGFAAMGIVETLVHTHDLTQGLGLPWNPPADLCARVLTRLFPTAPTSEQPWPTLLWATGRTELPGHARRTNWRWENTPRA
ncbi:maleylpyruvate isomerase N-terminal domain-containing protein [Nocardia sp. NPDC058666]|uniref:maleylpyruvate isomerase N-terminal domain-containing protein n=1 Tax=Nocardia sp. NPDC058666 TaxID=3346587 RepID=UPI003658CECD